MVKALVPTPNTGERTESYFTFWGELTILLYRVFGVSVTVFILHFVIFECDNGTNDIMIIVCLFACSVLLARMQAARTF